jgi:hypothetical protein
MPEPIASLRRASAPNRRAPGLLLAWLVLDASMGIYLGLNGPSTISRILLAAGIAFLLFVLLRRPAASERPSLHAIEVGLAALLAVELAAHVVVAYRPEAPAPSIPIPALALASVFALLLWHAPRLGLDRLRGWSIGFVVAAGLAARFLIIAFDVEPGFDVHLIQQVGGEAILAGSNPYLADTAYYAGYPYWPLSAVLAAGGLVFGDARWGLLVADAVTLVAFVVTARNVGLPGRLGALAAALLLWSSSGFYMTWQSLPEPAVIALAAVGVALLTRVRARGLLAGVAFGLAIGVKQLGLGMLPFLPLTRDRGRWVAFAAASGVSGAIVLAFLAWSPEAFLTGTVSSHLVEPARDYAVNLLDPLPGVIPRLNVPFVVTAILALGVGLAVRLRWPDSIDGWLAATIALFTIAFALIGISFVNYYQIPLALLLLLVLIPDGWTTDDRTTEPGAPRAA